MHSQSYDKFARFYHSRTLLWLLIALGIVLRLIQYLHDTSLWFDESRNALGIISLSVFKLVSPTPHQTLSLPIGFLMLEKLATQILGYSESALRLIPLFFGVASMFLFYKVARKYISAQAVPIAIALFAITQYLIELSSSVKPYAGDVAIALMLYTMISYSQSRNHYILRNITFGILGAVAVWISHPSVFILGGIGMTLAITCLINKEWQKIRGLFITFFLWIAGFLMVYITYTRPLMHNFTLTNDKIVWMKHGAFMPFPPLTLSDIQWFVDLPLRIFTTPAGLVFTGIASLTFLTGCIIILKENKKHFFLLVSPFILVLIASGLRLYVFSQSPILFLVPILFLFIAQGTEHIRKKISDPSKIAGIILVGLLFLHPAILTAYHVIKPNAREEMKPVLTYIKKNWQEGDIIYVYYMSQFAFEYYAKYHPGDYRFNNREYIIGKGPQDWYATYKREDFKGFWDPERPFSQPYYSVLQDYTKDIDNLRGHKRVWFLFSSFVSKSGINEEKFFVYHLETIGKQLDFFGKPNVASVYLYDLSDDNRGSIK